MGLYLATVIGFAVCTGIVGYGVMHFFAKPMNTHDSVTIDPKPATKY